MQLTSFHMLLATQKRK